MKKRMKRIALVYVLVCALIQLVCPGCATRNLLDVGVGYEKLKFHSLSHGPVVKAYATPDSRKLMVHYQVQHLDQVEDRWFHVDLTSLARRPMKFANEETLLPVSYADQEVLLSSRAKWDKDKMKEVPVYHLHVLHQRAGAKHGAYNINTSPSLGIGYMNVSHSITADKNPSAQQMADLARSGSRVFGHYIVKLDEQMTVQMEFPERKIRGTKGKVLLVLTPATLAFDIVTSPIQLIHGIATFRHPLDH
jgi:hypothetical protein